MAAKLGSDDVSFRLGSGEVAAVYLGSQEVWSSATVPGAPTVTFAVADDAQAITFLNWAIPASDGGSAITGYKFYFDGSEQMPSGEPEEAEEGVLSVFFDASYLGQNVEISAVNAVGEGEKSPPELVIQG
jgi:hypothetical protein